MELSEPRTATESQLRERRRSERVLIRIPIKVHAVGQDGTHVNEEGETIVVSVYGALLRTRSQLKPGTVIEVMNNFTHEVEKFRVVWSTDKPKEGFYDVGAELVSAREEFWGIRFPVRPRRA